jgi:hypothetical protein
MANLPTQWGSTQTLQGPSIGDRLRTKTRLVDVRLPTTKGGWISRDCTLYCSAILLAENFEGFPSCNDILCTLQTGMGGVTQSETFNMPAVGRSIHIVADSVRLDCEIPSNYPASFSVSANLGIGGLYPGKTHTAQQFITNDSLINPWYVNIPNYCTIYQLLASDPQAIKITPYYEIHGYSNSINGLLAVDEIPIPVVANRFRIESSISQFFAITFTRPS